MANKLPKKLTLKLECSMELDEIKEWFEYDGKDFSKLTLDEFINIVRERAHESFDFNAIEWANIYDEDNVLVAGEE